jgi:hypothetical protein
MEFCQIKHVPMQLESLGVIPPLCSGELSIAVYVLPTDTLFFNPSSCSYPPGIQNPDPVNNQACGSLTLECLNRTSVLVTLERKNGCCLQAQEEHRLQSCSLWAVRKLLGSPKIQLSYLSCKERCYQSDPDPWVTFWLPVWYVISPSLIGTLSMRTSAMM